MEPVRDCGAQFEAVDDKTVAVSFGDVQAECAALVNGVGITDLSHTTRVMHTGPDALDLLNRLTTNDLGGLDAGDIVSKRS